MDEVKHCSNALIKYLVLISWGIFCGGALRYDEQGSASERKDYRDFIIKLPFLKVAIPQIN